MNQTPEEIARDKIDRALRESGWLIQKKNEMDLFAGQGVAVREYLTEAGSDNLSELSDRLPLAASRPFDWYPGL